MCEDTLQLNKMIFLNEILDNYNTCTKQVFHFYFYIALETLVKDFPALCLAHFETNKYDYKRY